MNARARSALSPSLARTRDVEPLSVKPVEAARLLGCSRDFFDEHVLPELRVVRRGRLVLVAVRELERWLEANAERPLPEVESWLA